MVCDNCEKIIKNRKPGDRVIGVRREAYRETPPDIWPILVPVEGVLQSSYFDHPASNTGPGLPRHLLPDHPDPQHPCQETWWDVEHWVICDTAEEALGELERQARAYIAEAKRRLMALENLLPDVEAEPVEPDGCLKTQPIYRKDMSATYDEAMACLDGPENASDYQGDCFHLARFIKLVEDGGITDYDGTGDLVIDGKIYANAWICCDTRRVYLSDVYEVPFYRLEKLFQGHEIYVEWYNK